jgi:hypothetical protein
LAAVDELVGGGVVASDDEGVLLLSQGVVDLRLVVVGVEGEAANADKKTADTRVFTFTGEVKQALPDAPPVNSAAE